MLPGIVPLVIEAKMKGVTHSSYLPGWHWTALEGTAAFLRVERGLGQW